MKQLTKLVLVGMCSLLGLGVSATHAAEFSVRTLVGSDLIPPSVPAGVTAVPVSASQIDLSWIASVDNFAVAGYVVMRDGVYIATTTLTTFSDTGLLASTTYTYQVQAFDTVFNYSTTSPLVSTTTLALLLPPVVTSPATTSLQTTTGSAARVVLGDLQLTPTRNNVEVSLTTARPARFELRWGRTVAYELGYVITDRFLRDYETTITGLEPGTTYEFELIGYTPTGGQTTLKQGQFTTLAADQGTPPVLNVSAFQATAVGDSVVLSWQLPPLTPGSYVRIVRSHLGFPQHLVDGAVVYQGTAAQVVDTGIFLTIPTVYYTAFVVAPDGSVSSGAIAVVYQGTPAAETPVLYEPDRPPLPPVFAPVEEVSATATMPELSDITLTQGATTWRLSDPAITLTAGGVVRIAIPRSELTSPIKIITGTLLDPSNHHQAFSFLLRLNQDRSAYEAVLAMPVTVGVSQLTIEVYDFSALRVARYSNQLRFTAAPALTTVWFPDVFFQYPLIALGFGILCVVLFVYLSGWWWLVGGVRITSRE